MIRLLIVDDYPQIRDMLRTYFSDFANEFLVVGVAGNGQEAVAMVERLRPDVTLMDVAMPVLDGVTATERIRSSHPETRVITYTSHVDPELRQRALAAGALLHIVKPFDFPRLKDQVLRALA